MGSSFGVVLYAMVPAQSILGNMAFEKGMDKRISIAGEKPFPPSIGLLDSERRWSLAVIVGGPYGAR